MAEDADEAILAVHIVLLIFQGLFNTLMGGRRKRRSEGGRDRRKRRKGHNSGMVLTTFSLPHIFKIF